VREEAASARDSGSCDAGVGGRGSLVTAILAREGGFATARSGAGPPEGGHSRTLELTLLAVPGAACAVLFLSRSRIGGKKEEKNESLSS
jgi:hypothetical protein